MGYKNSRHEQRNTRTFVSLFSGCGGLDLGFVNAGFRCLSAYDIDDRALAVHAANMSGETVKWDLSTGTLPAGSNFTPDVILAGSPCQGFSTIGKREIDDLRNSLLISAGKIATRIGPRIFIAENVPAVKFGAHRRYWSALVEILQLSGYSCASLYLNASDFGVAQMRRRLFLVAVAKRGLAVLDPKPKTRKTLRDAIGDLTLRNGDIANHNPDVLSPTSTHFQIAKRINQGQKLCNVRVSERAVHTWEIPEVFGATSAREREVLLAILRIRRRERLRDCGDADPVLLSSIAQQVGFPVEHEVKSLLAKNYIRRVDRRIDLRHTFNGKYRRLGWESLSFTVDTSFGNPKNFLHPELHRGFTVREAARIQGFPDDFRFSGAISDQFKFIGNAVPPPLAQAIATEIGAVLNG